MLVALALLAVNGAGLLQLLFTLIIIALIFSVLWWLIGVLGLPAPFDKVIRVIIALVAAIILINLLMGLISEPFIKW